MTKLPQDKDDNQQFILNELQKGNERAFDFVFKEYYANLSRFSFSFVKEQDIAEELVQEVYLKLWKKREQLVHVENIFSYLMSMVRNQCIDYLRKEKLNSKMHLNFEPEISDNSTEEQISKNEFEEQLIRSILKLPERCRIAFELSRFDGCSNKEIAVNMKISIKGVEALIGRSLKFLRIELQEFLPSDSLKQNKRGGAILFSILIQKIKRFGIAASNQVRLTLPI
jgi:RNA polymerase sigma-70 factor, ECF subfamily